MRIELLGPLQVHHDERPVRVAGRRLQSLLIRLALEPGRRVSGSELVDAVWPDDVPSDPANALQSLVSRLRRALGSADLIEQDGIGYRLLVPTDAVDVTDFTRCAQRGRQLLADGDDVAGLAALEAAEAFWRGEPMAEADQGSYVAGRVTSLLELRLGANLARLDGLVRCGRASEAVAELETLAEANPLNEPVAAALIRALAAAGRTPEALARYDTTRRYLADQLGTDPGASLQALHLQLVRGEITVPADDPARVPATVSAPAAVGEAPRRRDLRATLTSFVGREDDLARVRTAVDAHRLTTLIGAGGSGKTRLAIEVANRWLADHDDPAWLIELAPVTDADVLAATVLSVIGGRDARVTERERMPQDARDRLLDRLRDLRCLMVIDNCEHLVDPVAHLVDEILAVAPDVRVLATSRELLGLTGEVLCAVGPLPLPPADVELTAAGSYPALQLWTDRAGAARPGFDLTAENLGAAVTIVRRLDGLPLAIELAAARLRVLPVAEIAERLSDRFRLLTGGSRTSLPRHRTLRAVVEWSWDLLSPPERLLAERLAVFPAGADAAGATAICADERLAADQIEQLLDALVDKSLLQATVPGGVQVPTGGSIAVRYRMLETIREYGVERLAERGELAAARLAHAEYYAAVVIECEPVLRSADQLQALARLDVDRDNVSAALRYLAESGRGPQALTMMLALAWYWSVLNSSSEIVTWASLILSVNAGSDLPGLGYARAALVLADVTDADAERPSWASMRVRLSEVSAELAAAPDPPFPGLEVLRCMVSAFAGDAVATEQMVARATGSADRWLQAAIHASLANLYENNGQLGLMRAALEAAYEEFVLIGDRWGLSTTLVGRAQLATLDGRLDDAVADFLRARQFVREMGSDEEDVYINIRLADLMIRRGDFDAARRELDALAEPQSRSLDSERTLFGTAAIVMVEWHTGHRDRALELSDRVRAELARRQDSEAMLGHLRGVILAATGMVAALAGRPELAVSDLRTAYPAAMETLDQPILAAVGTAVACWLAAGGRFRDAAVVLGAAASTRGADDWTDRAVATTRELVVERIGVPSFQNRYAEGRALAQDEARRVLDPDRYLSSVGSLDDETVVSARPISISQSVDADDR